MEKSVSVVMYHYVRPLENSRFPEIKGLDFDGFKRQIRYLKSSHEIIRMEDLLSALDGTFEFNGPTALLTFDDGFIDHMKYVLPVLHDEGIQGSFFPAAIPVLERKMLDVHRIHFIMAAASDTTEVLQRLRGLIFEYLGGSEHVDALFMEGPKGRFDSAEIRMAKRLLQRDLPREVRGAICAELFRDFVSVDEAAFVEELYLNADQLTFMSRCGMHIGSHAASHEWLGTLGRGEQERELSTSVEMLSRLGLEPGAGWTLAYPYGHYNGETLEVAAALGCRAAFTTQVGAATIDGGNRLTLQRFDTNDFPQ